MRIPPLVFIYFVSISHGNAAMQTIQITRRVDNDGVLRLEIPTEVAGEEIEVVIVIEPYRIKARSTWQNALQKAWGSCPDLEEPDDFLPEPLEENM